MGTLTGYYITVQKMLAHVTANTLREFARKTSDEDRVAYILSQDFVKKAFKDVRGVHMEGKSADESRRLREQGNNSYQQGDHRAALDYYTRALLLAPVTSDPGGSGVVSEELVLAQGNRSATLFQMHRYKESLEDIEIALKYGYPPALQYKLHDRQGRCHLELNDTEHALEAFENVLKVLDDSKLDEQQRSNARRNTVKQIEICKLKLETEGAVVIAAESEVKPALGTDPPPLSCEQSPRYPQASSAFDVKYSLEKGRYGVAAKDVKVGDVVISEEPFMSVLDPDQYGHRCYHCFKVLNVPLGCYQCMRVRFCSEKCRVDAWQGYHKTECAYLGTIVTSGTGNMTHLVLKSMLVTGLNKILKYKNNPKWDQQDAQFSLFTDSKGVYMGGFVGVYSLLTHTCYRGPNDLLQYTFLAIFILTILDKSGFLNEQNTEKSNGKNGIVNCIGGIILRFLQIVTCNGIEVTEMLIGENLPKSHPSSIGLGFFPTVCLINHSCDPVMELVFYENTCVARALRNIRSGQELTIDYGYLYYVTPKQQRQLSLKAQYFFDCSCLPCLNNWNTRANLRSDIPLLKCSSCGLPLPMFDLGMTSTTQSGQQGMVTCVKCNEEQSTLEVLEQLQKSGRLEEKALDEARRFQLLKAVPVLEAHVTLMDQHVCLPWKDYVTCTSMLKQCYRMMGNRARRDNTS